MIARNTEKPTYKLELFVSIMTMLTLRELGAFCVRMILASLLGAYFYFYFYFIIEWKQIDDELASEIIKVVDIELFLRFWLVVLFDLSPILVLKKKIFVRCRCRCNYVFWLYIVHGMGYCLQIFTGFFRW